MFEGACFCGNIGGSVARPVVLLQEWNVYCRSGVSIAGVVFLLPDWCSYCGNGGSVVLIWHKSFALQEGSRYWRTGSSISGVGIF